MSRPVRVLPLFGGVAVVLVFAAAACTTEFITEGGSCEVDEDCEAGEVCRGVVGADGEEAEPVGLCMRVCDDDSDCVGARDEVCRLEPDGVSGVCGRACVVDADCLGEQLCRFDRCVDPMTLADLASVEPPADGAPADGAADGGPDGQVTDGGADGAPVDGAPVDAAPVDAAPGDAATVDAAPVDAAPGDAAPADAAPDMAR